MSHRYCVIMCGGVGSRFWPYSREDRPKQFIDFMGTGRSLLQMSYDRILPLVPKENIVVVTNAKYAPLIREQLPDLLPHNILLEPARRNTAPCIAWAAYHIAALDPDASMIVAPSDHLITGESIYCDCVRKGFEFVESKDALLTLGITPVRPETGYGLWKASSIINALRRYDTDLTVLFDRGEGLFGTPREDDFIRQNFGACPANSIDYAVMEKADNVYVECAGFGWNDLGTWSALYDNSAKDADSNVAQGGSLVAYDSHGNIFVTPNGKLIVADGLKDYIVADAEDVLLICPKADEQRIKQMVNDVKMRFDDKFL